MKNFVALLVLAAGVIALPNVVKFDQDQGKVRVGKFRWSDCGMGRDTISESLLSVGPDPIQTPGPLEVGININITSTLAAPLVADLVLEKMTQGTWVKVPCLGYLGSCHYDDLCDLLSMIGDCPDPIVSAGLNCSCPIKAGKYMMPKSEFDIGTQVAAGDYHAHGNMTYMNKPAGCLDLYISFS